MPIRFATETCVANAPAPRSAVRHPFGILRILFILGFAAFLFPVMYAQVYSGSLTGVVADPSGAVVPGARAVLTDEQKGFSYSATADSDGRFVLRNLPPGKYSLSVTAQGMRPYTQPDITLNVGQNAEV